jgi:hypothetical protein
MTEITLTRKEIDTLIELADKFDGVQSFKIRQSHDSGIGATTVVKCSLFGNDGEPETTVDITDVSVW